MKKITLACMAVVLGGCGDGGTAPEDRIASIGIASGDEQVRFPGAPLLNRVVVEVLDAGGAPVRVAGLPVSWEIVAGAGSIAGDPATDARGRAAAEWTLGPEAGIQTARVRVAEAPPREVTARAVTPGSISLSRVLGNERPEGVWVVHPDGSDLAPVTPKPGEWPEWSPDGSSLIYSRFTGGNTWQLFSVSAPDWTERQLTDRPAPDSRGLLHMMPSFSPDGQKIVYHLKTSDPSCDGTWTQIFVADADGSDPVQLTDGCNLAHSRASFSPSGTRIAYRSLEEAGTGGMWSIWVMNADGSGAARITDLEHHQSDPVWAPDGSRIFYSQDAAEIWSVRPDGSQPELIHAPELDFFVLQGISPDGTQLLLDSYDGAWEVALLDVEAGALVSVASNAFLAGWRRGLDQP